MGWKANLLLLRLAGDAAEPATSIDVERSRSLAAKLGLTRYREIDPQPLFQLMDETRCRAVMVSGTVGVVVDDRLVHALLEGEIPRPLARLIEDGAVEEVLSLVVFENYGDLGAFALLRPEGIVRRWSSHDDVVHLDEGTPLVVELLARDADPDLNDEAAMFTFAVASYIVGQSLDAWDGLECDAITFDSYLTPE